MTPEGMTPEDMTRRDMAHGSRRRSLRVEGESFPLAVPFRISRGTKTAADVVTVTLVEDGRIGRGEGVPYPRYGESVAGAVAQVEAVRAALEAGATRAEIARLMPAGAARNAVDCALWDLELGCATRDFAHRTGFEPISALPTAMTVGLDTPGAMGRAAAALADVPLVKVKVDRTDPAAQLRAVRAAAPAPKLIVDPNESWTIAEVRDLQPLMVALRVDLLEQPLPADADGALAEFRSAVPVAADESVHTLDDLDRVAERYQVVNVKLDKSGGLTGALALADAAQARGLGLMTGCMICSSLSIAPAMAIAARSAFVDLDGPTWLKRDRAGGVHVAAGMLSPAGPGFWGGAHAYR